MSKTERDDVDWATAAEQAADDDEAQEGNSLEHDELSVEPAEHRAVHIVDDEGNDIDLDAVLDAMAEATDPEADAVIDDALDIDSEDEVLAAGRGHPRRRPKTSSTRTRSSAPSCASSRASGTSSTPTPASSVA